jgi:SAM-dependent methyltransferase
VVTDNDHEPPRPISGGSSHKYDRARAEQYDHDAVVRWLAGVRRRAVEALELKPGDVVLDIACGTGLNFGALSSGVGADGRVIGVDISPEMLEIAQGRIDSAGWTNVELVNAAVEDAKLPTGADAALFSCAHDVRFTHVRGRAGADGKAVGWTCRPRRGCRDSEDRRLPLDDVPLRRTHQGAATQLTSGLSMMQVGAMGV